MLMARAVCTPAFHRANRSLIGLIEELKMKTVYSLLTVMIFSMAFVVSGGSAFALKAVPAHNTGEAYTGGNVALASAGDRDKEDEFEDFLGDFDGFRDFKDFRGFRDFRDFRDLKRDERRDERGAFDNGMKVASKEDMEVEDELEEMEDMEDMEMNEGPGNMHMGAFTPRIKLASLEDLGAEDAFEDSGFPVFPRFGFRPFGFPRFGFRPFFPFRPFGFRPFGFPRADFD